MVNFAKIKDKDLIVEYNPGVIEETYNELPGGIYLPESFGGPFNRSLGFTPNKPVNKLVQFKKGPIFETLKTVEEFLQPKTIEVYKELKISHKMGVILYGPPGTGKTCTAYLIMEELIKNYNAVCFDVTGKRIAFITEVLDFVRKKQNSPIVLFVDEIDYSIRHEEEEYLTFLDGVNPHEQVLVIGCTNYIDKIPDRIKKRKSRIKKLVEINAFPMDVYREFVIDKLPTLTEKEIQAFSYMAEENQLTLDELKHAIIDYKLEDVSIEDAIKMAKSIKEND